MNKKSILAIVCSLINVMAGDIPAMFTYDFTLHREIDCDDVKTGYQTYECCKHPDKCIDTELYGSECCENVGGEMSITKQCTESADGFQAIKIVDQAGYYTAEMAADRAKYSWSFEKLKSVDSHAKVSTEPLNVKTKDFDMSGMIYGDPNYVHEDSLWGKRMKNLHKVVTEKVEAMEHTKDIPDMYHAKTLAEVQMRVHEGKLQGMQEVFSGNFNNFRSLVMDQVNNTVHPFPAKQEDIFAFQWFDMLRPTSAYSFEKHPNGQWTLSVQGSGADLLTMVRSSVTILDIWHLDNTIIDDSCETCDTLDFTTKSGSSITILKVDMEQLAVTPGCSTSEENLDCYAYVGGFVNEKWTQFQQFGVGASYVEVSPHPDGNHQYLVLEAMKQVDGSFKHNVMAYKGLSVATKASGTTYTVERQRSFPVADVYWPVYDVGNRGLRLQLGFAVELFLLPDQSGLTEDDLINLRMHYPETVAVDTRKFMEGDECFKNRHEFAEYLHFQYPDKPVEHQPLLFPPHPPPPPFPPTNALDAAVAENPCQCSSAETGCMVYNLAGELTYVTERCGCGDFGQFDRDFCYLISSTCTQEKIEELGLSGTIAESGYYPGVMYTLEGCLEKAGPAAPPPPARPPGAPPTECTANNKFTFNIVVERWSEENALSIADISMPASYSEVLGSASNILWQGTKGEERETATVTFCGDLTNLKLYLTDSYGDGWSNGWSTASLTISVEPDSDWDAQGTEMGFTVHGTSAGSLSTPVYVGTEISGGKGFPESVFCTYQPNCPDGGKIPEGEVLQVTYGPKPS